MNAQLIPLTLWLIGAISLVAGAARFGAHTAAIVAGVLLIKAAHTFRTEITKGWSAK